jgi:Flp pilus assembly protein TadB
MVMDQRLGANRTELLRHFPPEHRGTHWSQRSGVFVSYRGGMLLTQVEMPAWAPTALTLASIALVVSALVVLVRFWRNNNRR